MIRPEDHGALGGANDDSAALQAAFTAAAANGGRVELSRIHLYSTELEIWEGVSVCGPPGSGIKRIDCVRATLTSGFAIGSGTKVFTVDSVAGFAVGQSVMFINGPVFAPRDPGSHKNPVITAIDAGALRLTVDPRGTPLPAFAAGSVIQTASHGLLLKGRNILDGFTIDGNQANQTEASWYTHNEITTEGSGCVIRNLRIVNAPSDAILAAGPGGALPTIRDIKILDCSFDYVGCNAIHFGYAENLFVSGNRIKNTNMRATGINVFHQDGAVIFSNTCRDLVATGNQIDNCLAAFGSFDSSPSGNPTLNINDRVSIVGNVIGNCFRALVVRMTSEGIVFDSNRILADFPYVRWGGNEISVAGDDVGGSLARRPRLISITNNHLVNGRIDVDRLTESQVHGNIVDNSAAMTLAECLRLGHARNLSVRGNTFIGAQWGLNFKNLLPSTSDASKGVDISDNQFVNQKQRGLWIAADTIYYSAFVAGNRFRSRTGVSEAGYIGTVVTADCFFINNIFDLEVGTAYYPGSAIGVRVGNMINGQFELPAEFPSEAAAAAGGVPVGGEYRTGGIRMVRTA